VAIICHCEAVKERAIVESIRRGASSVCEVADACGAASRCGGCRESVEALVMRHARAVSARAVSAGVTASVA
jgi:bacterioferritin-associated ferredoxin